jgi:hypothetical protein
MNLAVRLIGLAAGAITLAFTSISASATAADQLTSGYNHVCARTSTNGVECWGGKRPGTVG